MSVSVTYTCLNWNVRRHLKHSQKHTVITYIFREPTNCCHPIHVRAKCLDLCVSPIICVTWLIRIWAMTHSYVRRDSFISVTWLIHMCDVTHSYVRRDSFICATWLIHMCVVTLLYAQHASEICKVLSSLKRNNERTLISLFHFVSVKDKEMTLICFIKKSRSSLWVISLNRWIWFLSYPWFLSCGVATISWILEIMGLFCRISSF